MPVVVSIYFRPFNRIRAGGRLTLKAPSGFRIETECGAKLLPVVDPDDEGAEMIDEPQIECVGDINPSNNGVIYFPFIYEEAQSAVNMLRAGQLYVLQVEVANPQSVSPARDWLVASFTSNELESLMDQSSIDGYMVSYRIHEFSYEPPATTAGTYLVTLRFQMSFPENVLAGDRIVFDAPFGFRLNEDGQKDCMQYRHLSGFLKWTQPTCGANRMTWALIDEMLPDDSPVSFSFQTVNPPRTPLDNFFRLQHLKPNDEVYASRLVPGFQILPQLRDVDVFQAEPKMEAVGSQSVVVLRFVAETEADRVQVSGRVDNEPFHMSAVTSLDTVTVLAQDETTFTVAMDIARDVTTQVVLFNVGNPLVAGPSVWDITTFSGGLEFDNRHDQKLGTVAFPILGRLTLKPSSSVSPNFYGKRRAIANFNMESSVLLHVGDVLRLRKPPGFGFIDQSLVTKRFVLTTSHGVDADGEHYYIVFDADILARTEAAFSLEVRLPDEKQDESRWQAQVFSYDNVPRASNDNLFPGFLLVGEIPFFVEPQMQTPGALNRITLSFTLSHAITATDEVRLVLTAPFGFKFAPACFYGKISTVFAKCTGQNNLLTLASTRPEVQASGPRAYEEQLKGWNAPDTPSYNVWKLAAFIDTETQFVNYSEERGFSIRSMRVEPKGNNQMGASGAYFWTFWPAKTANQRATIIVEPPMKMGYSLNCDFVYQLGLPKMPLCRVRGGRDTSLELTILNATIVAQTDEGYTFSFGVLNPGEAIPPADNLWALTLKNKQGHVIDSNRNVPGLGLTKFPAKLNGLAWSPVEAGSVSRVRIELLVVKVIEPKQLGEIQIISPVGVMFSDPRTRATVSPESFPRIASAPIIAAGNRMHVTVDSSQFVEQGLYGVMFDVKNPSRLPNDNTWSVFLIYKRDVLFQDVLKGYLFNEPSPLGGGDLVGPLVQSGACAAALLAATLLA